MSGLTNLGTFHTVLALVAVAAGLVCLLRDQDISLRSRAGQAYVGLTVLTCLTGFGIFQRGGFGAPHVLGILTLGVLALAAWAGTGRFGRLSPYVATVSYSLTFFFHMIPGLTETFTRVPLGAPLFSSPEDPALQKVVGIVFAFFVAGAALQVRRLRSGRGVMARA
ncbi:hypothetical protein [Uliginosibacterium sp. H1]|uniref:hypothetical protein n=1 Tax=Uliginosibacterium sp. H1 TaxID=3114757 RepID=UPI002E174E86|nr:hypothetical protein [Uliginosibacterium sp. H1]